MVRSFASGRRDGGAWCGCRPRYGAWRRSGFDILLDAALGEEQLFRDLAVRQALRHQAPRPRHSRAVSAARTAGRVSPAPPALRRLAELDDPRGQLAAHLPRKQRRQGTRSFPQTASPARPARRPRSASASHARAFFTLSQPLIGRGGLDADVQRDQRIVHPLAHGQQLLRCARSPWHKPPARDRPDFRSSRSSVCPARGC